jgi:hypothetical protein
LQVAVAVEGLLVAVAVLVDIETQFRERLLEEELLPSLC